MRSKRPLITKNPNKCIPETKKNLLFLNKSHQVFQEISTTYTDSIITPSKSYSIHSGIKTEVNYKFITKYNF